MSRRVLIGIIAAILVLGLSIGLPLGLSSPSAPKVQPHLQPLTLTPPVSGTAVCGTATLQSPWSYDALGSGTASYNSGTTGWGTTIPSFGAGGTTFPTATSGVVVAPGNVSAITTTTANTVYYFEPGSFNVGVTGFGQIQMGANDYYIGGYSGGTFAVETGTYTNQFGFTSNSADAISTATADWIEYMTVEQFTGYGVGASDAIGASGYLNVLYDNLSNNLPGSGAELGTDDVVEYNCMENNGDYASNAVCTSGANCTDSSLTGGPQEVTESYNEIAYNDQCNYEAVPAAYFPITPPSQCGYPSGAYYNGCGCAGGIHFWHVDGSIVDGNYIHDNYDVASWWDTDNNGESIEDDYYSGNFALALDTEISYNALELDDTFVNNAWGDGACAAAAGNPCYTNGNLSGAIYVSESGGNSHVVGNSAWANNTTNSTCGITSGNAISTLTICQDTFTNNWDGILLGQSSDRFCASPDNTSTGACTLGANVYNAGETFTHDWNQMAPAPSTTYYANDANTAGGCGQVNLTSATPSGSNPDYYDNCLWETRNVNAEDDNFNFTSSVPAGYGSTGSTLTCSSAGVSPCAENGLVSQAPSGISWSPYQTLNSGNGVPYALTNCRTHETFTGCITQNNNYANNCYYTPNGQALVWQFLALDIGNTVSQSVWTGATSTSGNYGQDAGSTFQTSVCSASQSPIELATAQTGGTAGGMHDGTWYTSSPVTYDYTSGPVYLAADSGATQSTNATTTAIVTIVPPSGPITSFRHTYYEGHVVGLGISCAAIGPLPPLDISSYLGSGNNTVYVSYAWTTDPCTGQESSTAFWLAP